jgi:hypothetical protein
MIFRWYLASMFTTTIVSSDTSAEMARMASFAAAIAFLFPRREIVAKPPSPSAGLSMSICAPVSSLIVLMELPPLPRMRGIARAGTVNLAVLLLSFSYSTAYHDTISRISTPARRKLGHFENLSLSASHPLLPTPDEHLVRFESLTWATPPRLLRSIFFEGLSRESDFDRILLFETDNIFATG